MSNSTSIFRVRTLAVWQKIYRPSAERLGKAILAILIFVETLVSVFWIYTLSGLGEGYVVMAIAPYFYIVLSAQAWGWLLYFIQVIT